MMIANRNKQIHFFSLSFLCHNEDYTMKITKKNYRKQTKETHQKTFLFNTPCPDGSWNLSLSSMLSCISCPASSAVFFCFFLRRAASRSMGSSSSSEKRSITTKENHKHPTILLVIQIAHILFVILKIVVFAAAGNKPIFLFSKVSFLFFFFCFFLSKMFVSLNDTTRSHFLPSTHLYRRRRTEQIVTERT
jgi:hypothetical protein